MPRPTELPEWASDPGALVTEPVQAKKDDGFGNDEEPAAGFLNWLFETIYDWFVWISAGNWSRASLTDKTPIWSFSDQNERPRTYVDPSGYFGGAAVNDHYVCRQPGQVHTGNVDNVDISCPGLQYSGDANCEMTENPAGGSAWGEDSATPYWQIRILDASTDEQVRLHTQGIGASHQCVANLDDNVVVMEGRFALETVGASEVDVFWGLHSLPQGGGASSTYNDGTQREFVMFEKLTGDTNWQLSVGDGAGGTSNDSGTPPVAGEYQTLRIELHGANTPVGVDNSTAPVARFFIDGVFEGEITDANVPGGASINLGVGIRLGSTATGPSADVDAEVGPIRLAHTQMLDWDQPQT